MVQVVLCLGFCFQCHLAQVAVLFLFSALVANLLLLRVVPKGVRERGRKRMRQGSGQRVRQNALRRSGQHQREQVQDGRRHGVRNSIRHPGNGCLRYTLGHHLWYDPGEDIPKNALKVVGNVRRQRTGQLIT